MTRVDVLCSDPRHPVNAYLGTWLRRAGEEGRAAAQLHRDPAGLTGGDFLFLVSCQQRIGAEIRALYRHTLVLHASALPQGRGMSPHVWQILEGRDRLTLTLLDAADAIDAGGIWHQLEVPIPRTALHDEIDARLFEAELALMDWALEHCDVTAPRPQIGTPSHYRRRVPADSRLDPSQTLAEAFDLLRVADPERYPAFFEFRGATYRIRLERVDRS